MPQTANDRPFEASNYKLSTYLRCPRLYYFEYLDEEIAPIKRQIKKPRPELEVGNAVHVALYNYFKQPQHKRGFPLLKQMLERVWQPPRADRWGFSDLEEERSWYKESLLMLKTFYDHQTDPEHLFYMPDPFSREQLIKIPLADDLLLQGKVDRIDDEGDGLHIIDYKTGKSQNDDDFQVMTYVILAQQKFGKTIKKASYFYLRTGQWKTYSPGASDAAVTVEKIRRIVGQIKTDTLFEARPSRLCAWCDFIEYCPKKQEAKENIEGKRKGESDEENDI